MMAVAHLILRQVYQQQQQQQLQLQQVSKMRAPFCVDADVDVVLTSLFGRRLYIFDAFHFKGGSGKIKFLQKLKPKKSRHTGRFFVF